MSMTDWKRFALRVAVVVLRLPKAGVRVWKRLADRFVYAAVLLRWN